jgi:hypothetical protein
LVEPLKNILNESLKSETIILNLDKAFNNGEPVVAENENYEAS